MGEPEQTFNRRGFNGLAVAGVVLAKTLFADESEKLLNLKETRKGDMLYRSFGGSGVTVSVIGVGGSHSGEAVSGELAPDHPHGD